MKILSKVRRSRILAIPFAIISMLAVASALIFAAPAPAHAAYWYACHSHSGIMLCLYDGHLSDGRVSISTTLQNKTSYTLVVGFYTLTAPNHWVVSHASGYLTPGSTWYLNKVINATSYYQEVRCGYGNSNGGILDGLSHSSW